MSQKNKVIISRTEKVNSSETTEKEEYTLNDKGFAISSITIGRKTKTTYTYNDEDRLETYFNNGYHPSTKNEFYTKWDFSYSNNNLKYGLYSEKEDYYDTAITYLYEYEPSDLPNYVGLFPPKLITSIDYEGDDRLDFIGAYIGLFGKAPVNLTKNVLTGYETPTEVKYLLDSDNYPKYIEMDYYEKGMPNGSMLTYKASFVYE